VSRHRRARALASRPEEPLDRDHALARFRHLTSRSITLGFVTVGSVVVVETPEALTARFESWLRDEVGRQEPS
jgi:hypothetical protein